MSSRNLYPDARRGAQVVAHVIGDDDRCSGREATWASSVFKVSVLGSVFPDVRWVSSL
jgi:hypothetical protein